MELKEDRHNAEWADAPPRFPVLADRLLLISPEQPREKAIEALYLFAGGAPVMLVQRFELSRADVRACLDNPTPDARLAALDELLDRIGVP